MPARRRTATNERTSCSTFSTEPSSSSSRTPRPGTPPILAPSSASLLAPCTPAGLPPDNGHLLSIYTPAGGEAFFRDIDTIDQTDMAAVLTLASLDGMSLPTPAAA
jgi:hypothetical protein